MKKLILVDGNSLMFRAYYATAYSNKQLMQTKSGEYTNALVTFIAMTEKILTPNVDNAVFAFDTKTPTRRHLSYSGYKAGRKAGMPDELASQIPLIHEYLKLIGTKVAIVPGFEADDIVGTLAKIGAESDYSVDVYSSDKDLLQLVSDKVTVHLLKSGTREIVDYTPQKLYEEYGLKTAQMIDFKALMGDSSDNIPGVFGIGEKKAITLLKEFQTLDNIYKNVYDIKGKTSFLLLENKEMAYISKDLVTIDLDVPLDFTLDETKIKEKNPKDLFNFYQKYELKRNFSKSNFVDNSSSSEHYKEQLFNYTVIYNQDLLKSILKDDLAIYIEYSSPNYHKASIYGVGLSDGINNYFMDPKLVENPFFVAYLEDKTIKKMIYDYKAFIVYLKWRGLKLSGVYYDLLLGAYLNDANTGKDGILGVAKSLEYYNLKHDDEIYQKGAKRAIPINNTHHRHIAEKAYIIQATKEKLLNELKSKEQLALLNEVELPLSVVLADMEYTGIRINIDELHLQKKALKNKLKELEERIYFLAGKKFNISSPKQLSTVLFSDLALDSSKKTQDGLSTNVDVLKGLINSHPIIKEILDYRHISKLFFTYIEGLSEQIYDDSRIHTIFTQTITATGRLSSIEPNLQNIPVKTPEGSNIRKIFMASENMLLNGFDYSQIELRILAAITKSSSLIEAFNNGEDIHEKTAKEIFLKETVTKEERRMAKTINFGILYGMGPMSLSLELGVTIKEAKSFIDSHLKAFSEIKEYMSDIVIYAKETGFVTTLLKRRRYIPELYSPQANLRRFGERVALNAPIQGSAADIIKLAMIKLYDYLKTNNKKTKLLLQIHDELILDVDIRELEEIKNAVLRIMGDAYPLKVKLLASYSVGENWYLLK